MDKQEYKLKKRGRKPVPVSWPDTEFTAEQIKNSLGTTLSRVSVHSKINKAVDDGFLTLVKKLQPKMGRPKCVYIKTSMHKREQQKDPAQTTEQES